MEKPRSKTQGHLLQLELFTWFQDMIRAPESASVVPTADADLVRYAALRRRVRELIKSGWLLRMSQEESPADKAGIDFIWQNAEGGWFALDAKAVAGTKCRLIRLVQVRNSTAVGEFRKLPFEDKVCFLELLVELASGPTPELDVHSCAPPSMEPTRNPKSMLDELRRFRDRLTAVSTRPGCGPCIAWSDAIGRAMGYVAGCQRQRNNPEEVARVQKRVVEIIGAYINTLLAAKAPRGFGSPCERRFRRSDKLLYTVHLDQLKVPVDDMNVVTVSGVARVAWSAFESRYKALIGKHGCAEWLLLRRRAFEAQGAERTINHLLDILERDPFRS